MASEYHVKRCFVALPVDEVVVADVRDVLRGVTLEGMRAVRGQNLHVTLKFLGDVEDPHIGEVIEAIEAAAEGVSEFELSATGFVLLPEERRARVLALEMDRPAALMRLVSRMEDAMEGAGFRREGRAYRPHVTVGRFKRPPRTTPDVGAMRIATGCRVDRVVLMESVLGRGGERGEYFELASVGLGG